MTLGKKPKRYQLRTGDRFAVTPKSGRGRFSIWPALLFVLVASLYYINARSTGPEDTHIAQQPQQKADQVITGSVPSKE